MDDTLWSQSVELVHLEGYGLNPCFSGWYSLIITISFVWVTQMKVLILVLVDDTLWYRIKLQIQKLKEGLNPCFSGWYSLIF